jgi:LysR family transcriptional regulator, carnitine catabolism transcriptional activator
MYLRQLEYLVAVADHGGFTSGAAAAHVAQPSLSARVRDLERELGVELFHRVGRGVRLSAAGEVVLDLARGVLADVAGLRAAAADVSGVQTGRLDLAALPTLAVDPLADLVGRFRRSHDGVSVRIAEADDASGAGGVARLVAGGRAELGLAELPVAGRGLISVPLADQELLVVAGPEAGIASARGRVGHARLAALPLILTPPGTSSRKVVEAALAAAGHEPRIAVEVAQREAVVPLVLAGAGIGFMPGAQAAAARAQGATVLRPDPPLVRAIGLVHREGRLSPAARAFVALAVASSAVGPIRSRSPKRQPKRPVL